MYCKIYSDDIDLVINFIDKWMKYISRLEKEIIKFETHSEDIDLLNNIFTDIHKLKIGSSFAGLSNITRQSYEMELILEVIREKKLVVSTEIIESILSSVDFLKAFLSNLHEQLQEYDLNKRDIGLYLEIKSDEQEEKLIKRLQSSREEYECQGSEDSKRTENSAEENLDMDMLQSDEFKYGLSDGVKEQFVLENSEHIEKIENDLLIRLDSNHEDREAINEIFRAIHSIKGVTGIYLSILPIQSKANEGLTKFSLVIHTFESLLSLVRDKGCKFDNDLIDLSLLVIDYLKAAIYAVTLDEFEKFNDMSIIDHINQQMSFVQTLKSCQEQIGTSTTRQEAAKPEDEKAKACPTQSIRVSQEKIDKIMNMISELLIVKNSFMHVSAKLDADYNLPEVSRDMKQVGTYFNRISDELQNSIMSIRMVEIKTIFQKMPRVIRDIAQSSGKKMQLYMEGEETEIDKTIIEQISDPLVHLIRNSADHGIETSEERLEKGKPEIGSVVLRAYNKNKYVFIEIEDDGKGIDAEKIKEKAIEKGIISKDEAAKMNQSQLINLIFLPGFSMAKQITEVSGRGVGMDIVKSNISKIKGSIAIESVIDKGTKMTIRLPLSLAVSRGLIVEVLGEPFIIPLEYIVETVKIKRESIHKFNERYFTCLRGAAIGMEWFCKIFLTGERNLEQEEFNAVILSNGAENYAIVVDKFVNEQEFVVKTLEGHLSAIIGISGSTLLGNGQVVLIVNPIEVIRLAEK